MKACQIHSAVSSVNCIRITLVQIRVPVILATWFPQVKGLDTHGTVVIYRTITRTWSDTFSIASPCRPTQNSFWVKNLFGVPTTNALVSGTQVPGTVLSVYMKQSLPENSYTIGSKTTHFRGAKFAPQSVEKSGGGHWRVLGTWVVVISPRGRAIRVVDFFFVTGFPAGMAVVRAVTFIVRLPSV